MPRTHDKDTDNKTRAGKIRGEIIEELLKQIEPYLPIKSLDDMTKKIETISIGSHRIPLKLIAPHVGRDAFPVKDAEDLRRKILEGAERAVSLGASQSFTRSRIFNEAVGTLTQDKAQIGLRLPAIYRTYYPDLPE